MPAKRHGLALLDVLGPDWQAHSSIPPAHLRVWQVVWGATKTAPQIVDALHRIAEKQGMAAATRVTPEVAAEVRRRGQKGAAQLGSLC